MNEPKDPFHHHPNLRHQINDVETSFHRTLCLDMIIELTEKFGLEGGWWYSDETREALRAEFMADKWGKDLWVFGYGSLMWDPALRFVEVRRACLPGWMQGPAVMDWRFALRRRRWRWKPRCFGSAN